MEKLQYINACKGLRTPLIDPWILGNITVARGSDIELLEVVAIGVNTSRVRR